MCFELCGPPIGEGDEAMADYDAWLRDLDAPDSEEVVDEEPDNKISEYDAVERFDKFLNEVYDVVTICGYDYDAARALKQCDEVAYREGFNNWLDSEGLELEWHYSPYSSIG